MRSKNIHIKLAPHLLQQLDMAAQARHVTRSEYMRQLLVLGLRRESIVQSQAPSDSEEEWDDDKWRAIREETYRSLE